MNFLQKAAAIEPLLSSSPASDEMGWFLLTRGLLPESAEMYLQNFELCELRAQDCIALDQEALFDADIESAICLLRSCRRGSDEFTLLI